MVKKAILLFTAAACFTGGAVKAQQYHCFADEMHARAKAANPAAVAAAEAQLKAAIDAALGKMSIPKLKVTAGDDDTAWKDTRTLHVPIVFHVVHNYGAAEYITDNLIYQELENINRLYRGANPDTSDVIGTYAGTIPGTSIKYVANTNIQFHLAGRDPQGRPTTGITRRRDHSTTQGGNHAKLDVWPRENYLNIWIVNAFDANHPGAAAYAYQPSSGAAIPWFDGPITAMGQPFNFDNTISHEIGHFLSLDHPWGGTNAPEVTCGDDGVDDTPPTDGHAPDGACNDLEDIWDTKCVLTPAAIGKGSINTSNRVADNQTGVGISFYNMEKIYIDDVSIYPADSGKPFTIQLKRRNAAGTGYNVVGSYSGITNTSTGKQTVPVRFVAPIDTNSIMPAYIMEFSVNPSMFRDLGSIAPSTTIGNNGNVNNVIYFVNDTNQGRYNYFYSWTLRYGDWFVQYPPAVAKNLFNIPPVGLATGPVVIDYPDTVNSQNVMDYTYCSKMFTYLQGVRMRATLRSSVAGRNNLIDTANLIQTGVMNPDGTLAGRRDLPPVADFSTRIGNNAHFTFVCSDAVTTPAVSFVNRTWRDTVSTITWTFSNGATTPSIVSNNPTTNGTTVSTRFTSPGWVSVGMIAQSNAGSDTLVSTDRMYVADHNAISPDGYFQEFNPGTDLDQYPIFNHFNNFTKWEFVNNAGFYDNTSIRYKQFDNRQGVATLTGTPRGDWDDFYTRGFDLSNMPTTFYLNFHTSGGFRTNDATKMRDTLEVAASFDCGATWRNLRSIFRTDLANKGLVLNEYTPAGFWDWEGKSVTITNALIPTNQRGRVYFRFRYKPGVDPQSLIGTGNNFYLDRINVSQWTTDVENVMNNESGMALAPNPTTGSTTVIIKDAKSTTAQVTVTDVTGKLVYSTQAALNGSVSRIEIPASYIAVKGMYLVSVTTGTHKQTEKLVVY